MLSHADVWSIRLDDNCSAQHPIPGLPIAPKGTPFISPTLGLKMPPPRIATSDRTCGSTSDVLGTVVSQQLVDVCAWNPVSVDTDIYVADTIGVLRRPWSGHVAGP